MTATVWWTLAQACVWIRTRDQDGADNLPPQAAASLLVAEGVVPGATLARHCLRAAVGRGVLPSRGWLVALDMMVASGDHKNWKLDDAAQSIPTGFWADRDFLLGVDEDAAGQLGEQERFAGIEFDRDRIIAHWPRPQSFLENGAVSLASLIEEGALRAPPEDNWAWFLGHPDVTVTGLFAATGQQTTIGRETLASSSFTVTVEDGDYALAMGGHRWSCIVVALGVDPERPAAGRPSPIVGRAKVGRPKDKQDEIRDYMAVHHPHGTAMPTARLKLEMAGRGKHYGESTIARAIGRRKDSDRSKSRPK